MRENHIDLEPDELRCDLGKAFAAPRQQISVAAYSGDDRGLFRPLQKPPLLGGSSVRAQAGWREARKPQVQAGTLEYRDSDAARQHGCEICACHRIPSVLN